MAGKKKSATTAQDIHEQTLRSRTAMRTVLQRRVEEMKCLLVTGDITGVEETFVLVCNKFDELNVANQEVYTQLIESNATEEKLTEEIDACDQYTKYFLTVKLECERRLRLKDDCATSTSSESNRRRFKLPQIKLKEFSGEPREWLPFWLQFQKIDNDPELDKGDKIQYLIMATKPGSRPRKLVESYPALSENYDKIISALKARFGREEFLVEIYIRDLIKQIIINATPGKSVKLETLYDNLETNVRSLETMGIRKSHSAAILYPLIESCLSENVLRAWQRSPKFATNTDTEENGTNNILVRRLNGLLDFLRNEVENEQRIAAAAEGLGLASAGRAQRPRDEKGSVPTAALLHAQPNEQCCAFCDEPHRVSSCEKARYMTIDEKKTLLKQKGRCFKCAGRGHPARNCQRSLSCNKCRGGHLTMLCDREPEVEHENVHQAMTEKCSPTVILQTLTLIAYNGKQERTVRALLDSGAQRSYITVEAANALGYERVRVVSLKHALFGGSVTEEQQHDAFKIFLRHKNYSCEFEALSQPRICQNIPILQNGPWTKELTAAKIVLSDTVKDAHIDILIGADVLGKLMTGRVYLSLGWTLMRKVSAGRDNHDVSNTVLDLLNNNDRIKSLWELDVLGIEDPTKKLTEAEKAEAAKELFLDTVRVDNEGRYEVALPWLVDHPVLPTNEQIARTRLEKTMKKLEQLKLLQAYEDTFKEWVAQGIIEEVNETSTDRVHYLPHRPVVKSENSMTKIRPVFDASARQAGNPSLNDCLEKGVNLIKLIPDILLGFRVHAVGVVSDIRKAFLHISVRMAD